MTYKKAYIIIFIYFLISVSCIFIFENSTLNAFMLIGLFILNPLLKGYAKDNKTSNRKKNKQ